jgi:serine/threonine-protein kinase
MSDHDDATQHPASGSPGSVGHYRLTRKIGSGGMGDVYLADDTKLERRVAVKLLPAQRGLDEEARRRFLREAQAAARLDHPAIVTVFEVGESGDRPFIVMRYVEGRTLADYISAGDGVLAERCAIVAAVADGLAHAHDAGVVHRDIKPSNIMLTPDGRPVVLDFGLAALHGSEMLTRQGAMMGTAAYMSPEQAQGHTVDHRSDLFSLGTVLYELLAGRSPFARGHLSATLAAVVNDAPDIEALEGASPELRTLVASCLAKDPSARPGSASALADALRGIAREVETAAADSRSMRGNTIAVLPFANMSPDPDNEYFADGLTEELLNVLAKNPELQVTARTSSFAFKGKNESIQKIGRELGVESLLEGSVRKAGDRVRVTAQLVTVRDGFHLWSETYDRVLDDIFAVQDDIAGAVSQALHVKLLGKREQKPTTNSESYALVLRARHLTRQMSDAGVRSAIKVAEQAIALDPENPLAWTTLAAAQLVRDAYFDDEKQFDHTLSAVDQALALDASSAEAHQIKGMLLIAFEFKWEEGGALLRRALELAPGNSFTISMSGAIDAMFARFDEALSAVKRALELDPLNVDAHNNLGRVLLYSGRVTEAEAAYRRALELSPTATAITTALAGTVMLAGRPEEALEIVRQEPGTGHRLCGLAVIHHALGNRAESDAALAELRGLGTSWQWQIAAAHAQRGEHDEALARLESAYAQRDPGIPWTRVHPAFRGLRDDPRFVDLLQRVGLLP